MNTNLAWSGALLKSRISNRSERRRYAGGSPNDQEVAAYRAILEESAVSADGTAVVLGMTPELRQMAVKVFAHVVAVDNNQAAIDLYRDWLEQGDLERETVVRANWLSLDSYSFQGLPQIAAFLGDGVFGNLLSLDMHRELLRTISDTSPTVNLVVRKALAAEPDSKSTLNFKNLLSLYRNESIDAEEFGFCARLTGFLDSCYDREKFILNNNKLFKICDQLHASGTLEDREMVLINRYRFEADNCILSRAAWENLLKEEGWSFKRTELVGKLWYPIYPIYHCWRETILDSKV